jgi:hypothetical protein
MTVKSADFVSRKRHETTGPSTAMSRREHCRVSASNGGFKSFGIRVLKRVTLFDIVP